MKLFIAAITLALFMSAVGASAQSLPETLQWMHDFVSAHSIWFIGSSGGTQNPGNYESSNLTFKGCQATQLLFNGLTPNGGMTFSLSDLDPKTIKSGQIGDDAFNQGTVGFETTNSKDAIMWTDEKGLRTGGGVPYWAVDFDSEANARRFATAFKHAVILCGGKSSAF